MADITESNAKLLANQIQRKAPEYFDLLTAETDAEFLSAFDAILGKVVESLEANRKNFQSLDENGLTGVLRMGLDIPGLNVNQETFVNGHVDIVIVAEHCSPMRKILCEAKIYKGSEYHVGGLKQLLGYITGREIRGLVIFYHRKKDRQQDIATSVANLRADMDANKYPCWQQGTTRDHTIKWSFFSTHIHPNSGEEVEIGHIGCNL